MQLLYIAAVLAALPTALTTVVAACPLGANSCDRTNTAVMICDTKGWKITETCYKAGACHVGPAGNAYCDKKIECIPNESQCDAAKYVAKVCNQYGFWETVRKCARPDCCEIRDGRAACNISCGPGLEPPVARSPVDTTRDGPEVGDYCGVAGERYCDAAHACILKCSGNHALIQEQCCQRKKCYYDNASLEPYCA